MRQICECGKCGELAKEGRRFINGHQRRGRTQSPESNIKRSESLKGKTQSQEHIAKRSAATKGRPNSEEHNTNISESMKRPEVRKKQSERMLNGGAAYVISFVTPPKDQAELFEKVKQLHQNAVLNFPSLNRSIDIALPDSMVAIEHDGPTHKYTEQADQIRQIELEAVGWRFLRYNYIPSIEKLKKDLQQIGEK